jgi:mannose-6-phosphate isomerase-like protein (cupin superfamily)
MDAQVRRSPQHGSPKALQRAYAIMKAQTTKPSIQVSKNHLITSPSTAPSAICVRPQCISHHDSDEIAYVLSGEVTFKIGDAVTVGGPGTCVFMPRDVPHAWKSTGAEPGRVLFWYTPGMAGKTRRSSHQLPNGTAGS